MSSVLPSYVPHTNLRLEHLSIIGMCDSHDGLVHSLRMYVPLLVRVDIVEATFVS